MLGKLSRSLGEQCKCVRWWFLESKVVPPPLFLAVVQTARLRTLVVLFQFRAIAWYTTSVAQALEQPFHAWPIGPDRGFFTTSQCSHALSRKRGYDAVTLER